jgi:HD-like signal output (HDOD) protein
MRDSNGVPARERTVASVLGALDSSEDGKHEVVEFIIEDFALTQKVLALANSPMYASFGKPAASVTAALKVIGANALMHVVLGAEMVSEEELQADENLSRALFASELARKACADRAEDASIATLMYEIGRLMTGKYLPDEAVAITKLVGSGSDPKVAESSVLGVTYQELGVELAARWNLPEVILSVIDGTGDPELVGIAAFSSSVSSLIHEGRVDEANELLHHLSLTTAEKAGISRLINLKTEEIAQIGNPSQPGSAEQHLLALRSDLKLRPEVNFDGLVNRILPAMVQSLQASHCLLLMMTRTGSFRVHSGYGDDIDVLKRKFKISAEFAPTPFHAAIRKNIDVSIADVGILKSTSLPEGYKELLPNVRRFVLLPIANGPVRAMMYCDWHSDRSMTKGEVKAVIALRNLLLPFMSH